MTRLGIVAIGSLAGFVACVVAYSFDPLPAAWDAATWVSPGVWLSVALLGLGLVLFVICLVSGLVSLLNWGADRPPG